MKKDASLRSFLRNIYGYAFFNKLMLVSPVYAVFMQNHGMSDMQLSILFILFSVAIVGTQIPASFITNKLGQKNAILFGQLLKGIGMTLWLIWPTFMGFAIGMSLWGMMSAFYNTAFEGLVYDELRARHHNHIYARVLGTRYNVQAFGAGLAAFGSLIMLAGYGWVTLASLGSVLMSMICIWRIKTVSGGNGVRSGRRIKMTKLIRKTINTCRAVPCMTMIMGLCLMVSNFAYLDDYLSPIGIEIGLPVQFVGSMQFFVLMCMILGQTFAYRFERLRNWTLYIGICMLGGCFLMFSLDYSVGGLLWLGIGYVLSSGLYIVLYSRFQDYIPAPQRTMMLSVFSILTNIIYMIVCAIIGVAGSFGSWRYSIAALGVALVMISMWAMVAIGNRCIISQKTNSRMIKTTHPVGSDIV